MNHKIKNLDLYICLIVLVLSSFLASVIQTSFYQVNISLEKLDTSNNQYIYFDLYKPLSASKENPAPFIAIIPGFQRSKEALSNIAIELSRRGYVVGLIDPYAQGLSSSSNSRRSATTEGYGMFALVEYVYGGAYDFINPDFIGATGHSMGGNAAIRGANYFGKQAIETNTRSKLHSAYVSGYVLTLLPEVLKDVRSNVGVSYALYDEGAFRNEQKGWANSYMPTMPEALRVVNGVLPKNQEIDKIELNKFYGSVDDLSTRVIHNEAVLHPFHPYDHEATANQLIFFDKVFGSPIPRNPNQQIWQWKEFFTLLNMIVGLYMLIPLTRAFLNLTFFSSIIRPIPTALPAQSKQGKVVFWSIFFLSALIACVTFIPMVDIAKVLFADAASRKLTWFFPQRMNNSVMLWAAFNGTLGLIIFFTSYYLFGRHHGVKKDSWGLSISKKNLVKVILLSVLVFISFYLILFLLYAIFHVDYRFLFMGVRIFQPEMLLVLLMYFPLFFVFFFSNSLRVNGAMRFTGQPEWQSKLIAALANSLGLILIIVIQYVVFFETGTVFWTTNWLSVNLLFGIVPMMFILPLFNRVFFHMTGNVYLGPLITCLVFIMILSTNTVVYLPI
ncbi:MAG: alpha/beta hydrolase [Pseudomonadota bacterium]|nr:alpha/beta hydrolase [Pseudomonadota bacterium]